jgi:hypothetical protein
MWKVRDKSRFLIALMAELAGNAHISFEGNLSKLSLHDLPGASTEETPILKRNTTSPRLDFVVLPLEPTNIPQIVKAFGGTLPKAIIHIQIEKSGQHAVGLYDNFHPDSIFLSPEIPEEFIQALTVQGSIAPWSGSNPRRHRKIEE